MKNRIKSALIAAISLLALAACGTTSMIVREEIANRLASPSWMLKREIPAAPFSLTAFERMHKRHAAADIYIEGDGMAWVSKSRISGNPTPRNPVALRLATRDKTDNVVYLARPCQYSGMLDKEQNCDSAYWGNKRFAPEVIAAYDEALNDIKRLYDIEGFNLIGFSGGGAVAALVAAQRGDVLSLRTVAGVLDHRTLSEHHGVSPLDGSLNPPEFSRRLAKIPQYHFIGGQDDIVPPAILHSYLQTLGPSNCVQYRLIQEAEHEDGWVDKWPELLAEKPVCRGPPEKAEDLSFEVPEPVRIIRDAPKGK